MVAVSRLLKVGEKQKGREKQAVQSESGLRKKGGKIKNKNTPYSSMGY